MELIITILVIAVGLIVLASKLAGFNFGSTAAPKKNVYRYSKKMNLITRNETIFFKTLSNIINDEYLLFPQVHLSSILDEKTTKQNWKAAFRHINQKSVDFVICTKDSLQPICAIELDDATHQRKDRKERDKEVERIFNQAQLPLIRFTTVQSRDIESVRSTIQDILKG